jgi:hypothetical protein
MEWIELRHEQASAHIGDPAPAITNPRGTEVSSVGCVSIELFGSEYEWKLLVLAVDPVGTVVDARTPDRVRDVHPSVPMQRFENTITAALHVHVRLQRGAKVLELRRSELKLVHRANHLHERWVRLVVDRRRVGLQIQLVVAAHKMIEHFVLWLWLLLLFLEMNGTVQILFK